MLRLEAFDDPQRERQERRAEEREPVQPDARGQADRERAQHDHRVLRIVDLRAIANQVGGADDAKGARQAGADDEHDQRADDGEHDLGLHDGRLPHRRAAAARPQREDRAQQRRKRQPDDGGKHLFLKVVHDAGLIDRLRLRVGPG